MAKIKHITIASQDPEKTAKFYSEVFDLQIVGKANGENAEGYHLSDGNVNIAVLRFKNETAAGDFGTAYSGIHHIGFQVEDAAAADAKLRNADSQPLTEINAAIKSNSGHEHRGRNIELKYSGPDGVMIDISQDGWVGTGEE